MVDGFVLHVTKSLRGRISPIYHVYFWRCCCQLFIYHRGPLVQWFATGTSMWLSYNTRIILSNIIRKKIWVWEHPHGQWPHFLTAALSALCSSNCPFQATTATGSGSPNHAYKFCQLASGRACRSDGAQNKSRPLQATASTEPLGAADWSFASCCIRASDK